MARKLNYEKITRSNKVWRDYDPIAEIPVHTPEYNLLKSTKAKPKSKFNFKNYKNNLSVDTESGGKVNCDNLAIGGFVCRLGTPDVIIDDSDSVQANENEKGFFEGSYPRVIITELYIPSFSIFTKGCDVPFYLILIMHADSDFHYQLITRFFMKKEEIPSDLLDQRRDECESYRKKYQDNVNKGIYVFCNALVNGRIERQIIQSTKRRIPMTFLTRV